ncbi:hypothetical protein JMJ56_29450 [Belnapia sp. T18]|uniref:XRE family transcriptional regulator n=1 Tax=Belnapia arida TaxID=2804533 RepID=A0ABS1UBP0_9PROT|nr:hypothetical protein [Belnapia arida]MBL6082107.1 hypothetical protein [Belnapia arida]
MNARAHISRVDVEDMSQVVDDAWGAVHALELVVKASVGEASPEAIALNYLAGELWHRLRDIWDSVETFTWRVELAEADNLRAAISRELEAQDIRTPEAIGDALGMLPDEATALLNRDRWQKGDVTLLEGVAARLGVQVPKPAGDGLHAW